MDPVNEKSNTYIGFDVETIEKDSEVKVGGHVRIWKYKSIIVKDYAPICLRKFLWLIKLKIKVRCLLRGKIVGIFSKKRLEKTNETVSRI